jgi:hypothetical protein
MPRRLILNSSRTIAECMMQWSLLVGRVKVQRQLWKRPGRKKFGIKILPRFVDLTGAEKRFGTLHGGSCL